MADTLIDLGQMQRRVDDLGSRIAALQQRVKTGADRERAQREELAALDQRHRALTKALADVPGGDAGKEHHVIVHKLAHDLDGAIANFTDWVDAEDHPAPPPGGFSP